jgi:Ferritin-like
MSDPLMPGEVRDWMDQLGWGAHHLEWHTERQWDRLPPAQRAWAERQGWRRADRQEGSSGNGFDFLIMHRAMLQLLTAQFPQYAAMFQGWASPPTNPAEPADPLPNGAQTPFDPNKSLAIQALRAPFAAFVGDDEIGLYIQTSARPTTGNPFASSQDPATGIHNYIHNRFSDESSPVDMGQPLINLGNARFWRLHGWIDDRWAAFRQAKGFSDTDAAYKSALDAAKMHLSGSMLHMESAATPRTTAGAALVDIPEAIRRPFRESLAARFNSLMATTPEPSTVEELQSYLQLAIKLEHFTLPLYLTAMWSLKPGAATSAHAAIIRNVAMQEMLHLGLVCNILTALGGVPRILAPEMLPSYPAELPGIENAKPFGLEAFSKDQVARFLEIELPEKGSIAPQLESLGVALPAVKFKTIGDFYDAIDNALVRLDQEHQLSTFAVKGQRTYDMQTPGDLFLIKSVADARKAIRTIKEQGEGTSASQGATNVDGSLAHYYAFDQIIRQMKYHKQADGTYKLDPNQPLPMPTADQVYPMAPVPAGGYPGLPKAVEFDQTYSEMLGKLQVAWEKDGDEGSAALDGAIGLMFKLSALARTLMKTLIVAGGSATYGPAFIYRVASPASAGLAAAEMFGVDATAEAQIPGYGRIKQILDDIVQNTTIGGHGPFWRTLSRDEFVAKSIFGRKLIAANADGTFDPDESNLVKALEGRPPFGADLNPKPAGAIFNRMPDGFPAAPSERIAEIRAWISGGCPEKRISTTSIIQSEAAPAAVDPRVHIEFWRDFDDWAMFHATPETGDDINTFFGITDLWMAFAKDGAQEAAWTTALADASVRQAVARLESHQRLTVTQHYGSPTPLPTLLDGFERFGDDSLPDDPARPRDVRHRMNGAIMWYMWSAFADACLRLAPVVPSINGGDWDSLGRAILLGLLNDGVFRRRYVVNGFTADDAGKQAMRKLVLDLTTAQLPAELATRFRESQIG